MKLESNVMHFVPLINVTKIVFKRAQWAELAGPSHFTQRADRKKSAHAHLYCEPLIEN